MITIKYQKNFKKILLALLCAAIITVPVFASESELQTNTKKSLSEVSHFAAADVAVKALFIDSFENKDYPSQPNSKKNTLKNESAEIVSFAKEYQFNTLVYQLSPLADSMFNSKYLPTSKYLTEENTFTDPFKILLKATDEENLNVCAAISMFYAGEVTDTYSEDSPVVLNPDWFLTFGTGLYFNPTIPDVQIYWSNILTEIVEKYEIDALILSGIDVFKNDKNLLDDSQKLIKNCIEKIAPISPNLSVGLSVNHNFIDSEIGKNFILQLKDNLHFISPKMLVSLESKKSYEDYLSEWNKLIENTNLHLYTENQAQLLNYPLISNEVFGDERELAYQLYANSLYNVNGFIINSYSDINKLRSNIAREISLVPETVNSSEIALQYDNDTSLSLAESSGKITTSAKSYYLSGRCDPNQALYINNEQIEEKFISKDGFWGKVLDLQRGSNIVTVKQGNNIKTINIYSSVRNETEQASKIEDILEESVYPQGDVALYEGEALVLSCTAPYGGSVSARFQDKTYYLTVSDEYTDADIGKAVEYSLEIYPENIDSTQTVNLGNISYTLTYKDFTSKYRSDGQIYSVGHGSRLAVEVKDSLIKVYQSPKENIVIANLPTGAFDYAADFDSDFYRLYYGGYVHKNDVSIVEGFIDIQKSIQSVGIQHDEYGENIIFVGGEGLPYYTSYNEHTKTLTLQISNVVNMPASLSHLSSNIFDKILVSSDNSRGVYTIRLHLADEFTLWGYQVAYQNGNLYLKCKTPPPLSNDSKKPLDGISVVLDAGHGGADVGAKSVWGENGPQEKDINLAYAQNIKHRLEELGADVFLTRSDDSDIYDDDRIVYNGYKNGDFYISIHLSETTSQYDAHESSGLSVYYDNELSHKFGQIVYNGLSDALMIEKNHFGSDDVSIIKVPLAQAIVLSPGNISNPYDYERITNPTHIYKTSCELSDAILDYLKSVQ